MCASSVRRKGPISQRACPNSINKYAQGTERPTMRSRGSLCGCLWWYAHAPGRTPPSPLGPGRFSPNRSPASSLCSPSGQPLAIPVGLASNRILTIKLPAYSKSAAAPWRTLPTCAALFRELRKRKRHWGEGNQAIIVITPAAAILARPQPGEIEHLWTMPRRRQGMIWRATGRAARNNEREGDYKAHSSL